MRERGGERARKDGQDGDRRAGDREKKKENIKRWSEKEGERGVNYFFPARLPLSCTATPENK